MKRQSRANSLHNRALMTDSRLSLDKDPRDSGPASASNRNGLRSLICTISLTCLILSSCANRTADTRIPADYGRPQTSQEQLSSPPAQKGSSIGQNEILQAQAEEASKVEVLFSARVKKLLPDDTKGLPHQLFLLELENGSTVKVAHDTKYAARVPIQAGDRLTIKGEYIWNKRGGVVHWTHHSDTPRHEGGYIEFAGQRYD